ncbi:MAG: hypothetical protein PGN09_09710 [Sphingomonas fennica]
MTDDLSPRRPGRARTALIALLLAGGGAVAGGAAIQATRPPIQMAPATPTAIRTLTDGIVTIRGRAVERFGNKLVIEDATGRALVDLGREGEDGGLVRLGETVTAQGQFEHGFVRGAFLVGADGKVVALGPLNPPPHPHRPDGPPPPPPGRDAPPPPADTPPPARS